MGDALEIYPFELGDFQTNCYVAAVGEACWIVDAGYRPEPMIEAIREKGWTPQQVVLTHAHCDHIAGLAAVRQVWPDLPILIHDLERDFLTDPRLNLSAMLGVPVTAPQATGRLEHGQTLSLNGVDFELRHAPGHSPGSMVLYQPQHGLALAGDTLFAGSVGRTDFPLSDHQTLMQSIRGQLYTLPDDTRVLPGHGPETRIGTEKRSNPFVQGQ